MTLFSSTSKGAYSNHGKEEEKHTRKEESNKEEFQIYIFIPIDRFHS